MEATMTLQEWRDLALVAERAKLELSVDSPARVVLDLGMVHELSCPLDFALLMDAPKYDFWHDVQGVAKHLNRWTGELGDCFLPRCARRDA